MDIIDNGVPRRATRIEKAEIERVQAQIQERRAARQQLKDLKATAKIKLLDLGLTEEELRALWNI